MFAIIWMGSMKYKTNALPCIALTTFKHKNGHLDNNEPFKNQIKASLATHRTKPGYDAKPFLAQAPHI